MVRRLLSLLALLALLLVVGGDACAGPASNRPAPVVVKAGAGGDASVPAAVANDDGDGDEDEDGAESAPAKAPPNQVSGLAHSPHGLVPVLAIDPLSPEYRLPLSAWAARQLPVISAVVTVAVDAQGFVTKAVVRQGVGPEIDLRIEETVQRWRYQPVLRNGKAIPFAYTFRFVAQRPPSAGPPSP